MKNKKQTKQPLKSALIEENFYLKHRVELLEKTLNEILKDIEKAPSIVYFDKPTLERRILAAINFIPF